VVRYEHGQHFHYHTDAGEKDNPSRGRMVTALFYLNEAFDGGEDSPPWLLYALLYALFSTLLSTPDPLSLQTEHRLTHN
jgi:hypothetical protein